MVLSLHIGGGFEVIRRPEEAPIDHLMVLACQISAITAQDLLFGPTLRKFPELKVALSEGGIGWIPFYFDRIDRHFQNQAWLHGDADPVPVEEFAYRMEEAGLIELCEVTEQDLESHFAYERGIEPGGHVWRSEGRRVGK